jgi:hypothetical protein
MSAIEIPGKEALARLAEGTMIEARFESRPNTGVTHAFTVQRESVVEQIQCTLVYEGGETAQRLGFGIYIYFIQKNVGAGLLFFQTKPECRLTEAQLAESLRLGHGQSLFSVDRKP